MSRFLRYFTAAAFLLPALVGHTELRGQAVGVNLNWLYPAESIFLSDFDPFSPGNQPDLFAINIVGGSGQSVILEIEVTMIHPSQVNIFRGTTNAFSLPLGRTLTNRDLATRDQPWSVREFDLYQDASGLNETLRQTGRFPAGRYRFRVQLRSPGTFGTILGEATIVRELSNPTRIDLLGPGVRFGATPTIVTSPAPRFLWSADAGMAAMDDSYRPYRIRVSRVDGAASAEEAIEGFPVWDENTAATSAVYPGSASAIPLDPGATYAWQVVREVRTSGGTEEIESPIYWFRMAPPTGSTTGGVGGTGAEESAAAQIQYLADLFGLGGEVEGFEPRGTIFVDGVPMPIENFMALLRRIVSGEATVHSITVQ